MTISVITKEKLKALMRQQTEYDPEPAIKALDNDDFMPSCRILENTLSDISKRCGIMKNYSEKIAEVFSVLVEETKQ